METYVITDDNGQQATRRGRIVQNKHGLYYFIADYNKAKLYSSISLYRMAPDTENTLVFADYRRKKTINVE